MASAGRRSEQEALVFDLQYIQFKPKGVGVTLYFSQPDFGAPNCPVRALRYFHRYMTEHAELRKGRANADCLFQLKTTTRGRSSVQPLSLDGYAPLQWCIPIQWCIYLMLPFRTARVSQDRSKLMKFVLWLLHCNFSKK